MKFRFNFYHFIPILLTVIFTTVLLCSPQKERKVKMPGWDLVYETNDNYQQSDFLNWVKNGKNKVEKYFNKKYPKFFSVRIFPDRTSLTNFWRKLWNMPDFKPACWMVASGRASGMAILSPRVWKTEACEHDPEDKKIIQALITHELTHVFHGQVNKNKTFDGMENVGWFVEGVAVLVSDQIRLKHAGRATEAVKTKKTPTALKNAWSGPYRYSNCGTIVYYIEQKFGRKKITEFLEFTAPKEFYKALNLSEEQILQNWKSFVLEKEL
jgi:hypothetical protein